MPTAIPGLHLQLFPIGCRNDREQIGAGIPVPSLGGKGQIALVDAPQDEGEWAVDDLPWLQQEAQGVALP